MIAAIAAERTEQQVPVAASCRALGVSPSWFYKHHDRPPSAGAARRAELDAAISAVFDEHDGTYGSPRIYDELVDAHGWTQLSVNTVAARMRALGLAAKVCKRGRSLTKADPVAPKFPNLLCRDFDPAAPNVAWCGDITEIVAWDTKLYLATVIELYSRRLLGFAIAEHQKASLVCDALRMAIAVRGGNVAGVKFHSDRGSQYTSNAFTQLCTQHDIVQSMSRSGCCLDNAVAESFFASLKTELVYRCVFATGAIAWRETIRWIDRYNTIRRHSHCGNVSPIRYEHQYAIVESPQNEAA